MSSQELSISITKQKSTFRKNCRNTGQVKCEVLDGIRDRKKGFGEKAAEFGMRSVDSSRKSHQGSSPSSDLCEKILQDLNCKGSWEKVRRNSQYHFLQHPIDLQFFLKSF